ncbi:MAG: TetR/AcrR family transcriptional regulator [Rhodobiaceae bacterium]|nr:TetR/AcrR family transcriptional regulator [Rhodobiaceae bacterium]
MSDAMLEKKRRNAKSHEAILEATISLLGSSGYVDFSIEKVAAKAGVGKQTIYRWWPTRADLVLEVWRDRLLPPMPPYDGKTALPTYLGNSLLAFGQQISRTDCRQAAICILAEAHRDPDLHQRMAEAVYLPRISLIKRAFQEAQESGAYPKDINVDVAIDALYGAVWYKVLIRFETVDRSYIETLVGQYLNQASG